MLKFWQKHENATIDIFRTFTTGNNYQLDQTYFLEYDLKINRVWADVLYRCEIYTESELQTIQETIDKIKDSYKSGSFTVKQEDENGHNAIENALIKFTGNIGTKINIGRSRNEQQLTAVRMFMLDIITEIRNAAAGLADKLQIELEADKNSVFIGYSHTQQAAPTTIGHYFAAHSESLQDDVENLASVYKLINKCPLGTGAGFGSPLEMDRLWIAKQLGFHTFQNNSLYCQNSFGKFELLYIQALSQVMLTLQRLATDMILYTSREYSLFKMSDNLSQYSNEMPHKRNPDVFEMIRAKSADVLALEEKVKLIVKGLPSGYNRDLQEIKACVVDTYNITRNCLYITGLAIENIKPDLENIYNKLTRDTVASDYATSISALNKFSDYKDVYKKYIENIYLEPHESISLRRSKGSSGDI